MKITLISLIYLFGAAQSLLLLVGVNINKPFHSDLKKITSLLLLSIMIVMVYYVAIVNEWKDWFVHIDSFGQAAWMSIFPSYYLLNLSLQVPKWQLEKKHLIYFIIPIVFTLEGFLNILGLEWNTSMIINDSQLYLDVWMLIFFGTGFYSIISCIALYQQQRAEDLGRNKYLVWLTYAFLSVLLVFGILYLFIRSNYMIWFEFVLITLLECFVFLLVYRVFKFIPFQTFFEQQKYSNKQLSKQQLKTFALQLEKIMEEEQPFLNKKLSLNNLAQLSGINTNDLSQLFKSHYNANFYDFVKRYRLSYLETLILDPSNQQYKIMALAEKSGFNSKATFYKVFKEKHELTPVQFIKKQKQL